MSVYPSVESVESYTVIIILIIIGIPSPTHSFIPGFIILIIIGIPSPTHSFIPGFKPSISANPSYRILSFSSFRIHYMDSPDSGAAPRF